MTSWVWFASGCVSSCSQRNDTFLQAKDTSYKEFPELKQVSAACDGGQFDLRARTVGWSETGVIQIWQGSDVTAEPLLQADLLSQGFRRDEWCDFLEAPVPDDDPDLPACSGDLVEGYTALLRVTYESGCAGEQAIGVGADDLLRGGQKIWPTEIDSTCPAPGSKDWLGLDEAEQERLTSAEIVESVPTCDVD